jgi:hypothetical protein
MIPSLLSAQANDEHCMTDKAVPQSFYSKFIVA